jgi:potassium efflux system protein
MDLGRTVRHLFSRGISLLAYIFLFCYLIQTSCADDTGTDPAGIGLTMGELRALATDENNPYRGSYSEALKSSEEILELENRTLQITSYIEGIRQQKQSEFSKIHRDNTNLLKDLKKLEIDKIQPRVLQLQKSRDECLDFLQEVGEKLDELRSLSSLSREHALETPKSIPEGSSVAELSAIAAYNALINARSAYYQFLLSKSGELLSIYGELMMGARKILDETNRVLNVSRAALLERRLNESYERYSDDGQNSSLSGPVDKIKADNRSLALQLRMIYGAWDELGTLRSDLEAKLYEAKRIQRNLAVQIKNFTRTLFLARQLFSRRELIPELDGTADIDLRIEELRILQYSLSNELESLTVTEKRFLAENYPGYENLQPADIKIFENMLSDRLMLISKLYSETGMQLGELIEIKRIFEQYEQLRKTFNDSLLQEKFWTPAGKIMDFAIFSKALSDARKLAGRFRDSWGQSSFEFGYFWVSVLILWIVLILFRGRLLELLKKLGSRIGTRDDSHWLVWQALIVYILRGLIPALCVTLLFQLFNVLICPLSGAHDLFIPLIFVTVWVCETLILMHGSGGIDELYFRLGFHVSEFRRIKRIYRTFVAVVALDLWIQLDPSAVVEDHLGQLFLFIALLVMFYSYVRLTVELCFSNEKPWTYDGGTLDHLTFSSNFLAGLYDTLLALMLLFCLILTFFGYHYTALILTANLAVSVFIVDVSFIFCRCIFRTVRLSARRIKLMHNLMDRHREGSGADAVEVEDISRQAHWFISLVCSSATIFLMYNFVWDELVHLTSYFRHIDLYTTGNHTVSMWDVLVVIYAGFLTFIVCLNFPGFLKMLIFKRVKLLNQYSYSVITVLNYMFVGSCIIFCAYRLGLSWDKLQWLIAALSVGLGFGLQEIFANFVSGLILLFERPVRIGDTITLDGHSGKVTRIQIRATTITDFDRMEYIVPNRKLITSSLVNWTLSDTISRIVIRITCSQGADSKLVKDILTEIVSQCPYVIAEPKSNVCLAGFDDGVLNFQIKAFVARIDDRNPCIDALNEAVYCRFKNLGIRMAVRGVDVYVTTLSGDREQKVASYGQIGGMNGEQNSSAGD